MNNVNDKYFDGHYKDIWRSFIPDELTLKETAFMVDNFRLNSNSKVLDLMCGYGRHAIALSKRGIAVTAVDNLHDYIDEIIEIRESESLPIEAFQSNAMEFHSDEKFDLVICMGNSLNFFNAGDTQKILHKCSSFLKRPGSLLINSWSLAEIAIRDFRPKTWSQVGNLKFIQDDKFLFKPTRIESKSFFLAEDGTVEEKNGVDYIFSINEMEQMLNNAGFAMTHVWSIPAKKEFSLGDPRAYIVAQIK